MEPYINRWGMGFFLIVLLLVIGYSVMTLREGYADAEAFKTDKTDRMLIKDILINQQETLSILREVKAMLQEIK